jgi:predicted transcriptional regulator
MARRRPLGRADLEIMEAVWKAREPVSVRTVHDQLSPGNEKAYTTVQTIMNILTDKGILRKEKVGMANFYAPVMTRDEATRVETHSLVARLFAGSFGDLAAYLVESGELSESEMEALRSKLERQARKR